MKWHNLEFCCWYRQRVIYAFLCPSHGLYYTHSYFPYVVHTPSVGDACSTRTGMFSSQGCMFPSEGVFLLQGYVPFGGPCYFHKGYVPFGGVFPFRDLCFLRRVCSFHKGYVPFGGVFPFIAGMFSSEKYLIFTKLCSLSEKSVPLYINISLTLHNNHSTLLIVEPKCHFFPSLQMQYKFYQKLQIWQRQPLKFK